ncbi:MAG: sporulation transcriptional regulator SpoIIID [Clostridia bacterium]|nr:sporulation transcriptional regulator SpoIIID [Clostridia bacterium]
MYSINSSHDYIEDRVYEVAQYILDTGCTVRAAAAKFEISKSTVHKDVSQRLPYLNPALAESVRGILNINKAERHIRGGLATKEKYLHGELKCRKTEHVLP